MCELQCLTKQSETDRKLEFDQYPGVEWKRNSATDETTSIDTFDDSSEIPMNNQYRIMWIEQKSTEC